MIKIYEIHENMLDTYDGYESDCVLNHVDSKEAAIEYMGAYFYDEYPELKDVKFKPEEDAYHIYFEFTWYGPDSHRDSAIKAVLYTLKINVLSRDDVESMYEVTDIKPIVEEMLCDE